MTRPPGIDNVSDSVIADLGRAHHLLDRLETNLGNAHAGLASPAGDRQRHAGQHRGRVGHVDFAEMDRTAVDPCATATVNFGSPEKSALPATTSMAISETRSCSFPVESSCARSGA